MEYKFTILKYLFFIFSIFASYKSSAQLAQKIDTLFQSYHQNGLFEGTTLIADSSGIVYHKAFGLANRAIGTPNDTNTIFRLGSLEKQFTAMLVLQLIEKGKLKMQAKITHYLPTYRRETGNKVTIEHLLTHTSGIPNYTALPNVWNDSLQLAYPPEYLLKKFCSGNLEFEPGAKYKYSNTGYFILAQIIQKVSGKPLASLLNELILKPAKMKNTGLEDNSTKLTNKALGYYRLANLYINEPYIYAPNAIGAASIYSTAGDLYLWDRILYTTKLLSEPSLQSYLSPHFTTAPNYAYGFGWEFTRTGITGLDTIETMEHSGAIRAFRAVIFRIPKEKKCIILLSNCANQSAYDIFENVIRIFKTGTFGKPKPLLADTLYSIMQKTTIENTIQSYGKLKAQDSTAYNFNSSSLEFLGERLLLLKNYEAAIAIFQLAVSAYPTYISGYFYIGNAYEKSNKPTEAIKAYQKAVDQDKNSRPGVDAAFQIKHLTGHR